MTASFREERPPRATSSAPFDCARTAPSVRAPKQRPEQSTRGTLSDRPRHPVAALGSWGRVERRAGPLGRGAARPASEPRDRVPSARSAPPAVPPAGPARSRLPTGFSSFRPEASDHEHIGATSSQLGCPNSSTCIFARRTRPRVRSGPPPIAARGSPRTGSGCRRVTKSPMRGLGSRAPRRHPDPPPGERAAPTQSFDRPSPASARPPWAIGGVDAAVPCFRSLARRPDGLWSGSRLHHSAIAGRFRAGRLRLAAVGSKGFARRSTRARLAQQHRHRATGWIQVPTPGLEPLPTGRAGRLPVTIVTVVAVRSRCERSGCLRPGGSWRAQ